MTTDEIVTITVDCHAYPWHEEDPNYPECGPANLTRMAEEFGVLIRYLPDHDLAGWAWMYEATGPRDHLIRWLMAEYGADEGMAEDMVDYQPPHDCFDHAVPYTSDGPLGHGWECGVCGAFLQAG